MVAARLKPIYEEEARKRQGTRTDLQANLPESDRGQARDKAAAALNVSPRSVENASAPPRQGELAFCGSTSLSLLRILGQPFDLTGYGRDGVSDDRSGDSLQTLGVGRLRVIAGRITNF